MANVSSTVNGVTTSVNLAGQTVILSFLTHGDGTGDYTNMYVDDVTNMYVDDVTISQAPGGITLAGLNNTVTVGNAAGTPQVSISSPITTQAGAVGNLIKSGSGTLVLSGANTYTGQTLVNQGVLQLQRPRTRELPSPAYTSPLGNPFLGTDTVVASGASIQIRGTGFTFFNSLVLNGTGASGNGALENLAGGSNTWAGNIILATPSSIGADAGTTLTLPTATVNGLTTGGISGVGDLTKVGSGTVVLNAADTYTGNTFVNGGILNLQNALALGLASTAGGGAVTVNSGASLQIQGGLAIAGKNVTLNGTGFGNVAGQTTSLPEGALVSISGTSLWTGNIVLTGAVALTGGTLPLLAASNTGSLIGAASGSTLQVAGVVSGTDLTKAGAGALQLLDIDTFTGAITVLGGFLYLLNNNNAAVGPTTVTGSGMAGVTSTVNKVSYPNFILGQLSLGLYGTLGTSSVTIDQGGTVTLDNSALAQQRFTNATAPNMTFNTGSFQYLANNSPGAASSETVGTITLASGLSTILVGFANAVLAGATSLLTAAGLIRSPGATVNFIGGSNNVSPLGTSTTNKLLFTTAPSGSLVFTGNQGTILPFAEVNGTAPSGGSGSGDFATYGANGITAFTNYATQTFAGSGTLTAPNANGLDITKVVESAAGTITVPAGAIYGALLVNVSSGVAFTLALAGTTTITNTFMPTGTVGSGIAFLISGGSINLTGETIVFQNVAATGTTNVQTNSTITGTGPLVISGSGAFQLNAANTYSGGTIVDAASNLYFGNASAFGSGAITLTGGAIAPNLAAGVTLNNAIVLNGAVSVNAQSGTVTFTGPVTVANNSYLANATNIAFDGVISGSSTLNLTGSSTVTLNNANTFTGGVGLIGGTVTLNNNAALGTGALTFLGGSLTAAIALSNVANTINLPNTTANIGGANNITFSGTVTLTGVGTIADTNVAQTILSGTVGGAGALSTAGTTGTLVLASANTYSGASYLSAGTIILGNNTALGTGTAVLGGVTLLASSALSIGNSLVFTGSPSIVGVNPLTFTGPGVFLLSPTLTINNATTFSGTLGEGGGSFGPILQGLGTVTIGSGGNYFSGGVNLNMAAGGAALGTLIAGSPTAFGVGTLTLTGGNFQAGGLFPITTPVAFGTGGVVVLGGTNPITFQNTLTNTLTSTVPSELIVNTPTAINSTLSGAGGLTLLGGTSTLSLTGANTYTGTTTVSGGTLTLSGANGAIASAATVNSGGTLLLDDTSALNSAGRLSGGVNLNGGTLSVHGTNLASTVTTETIGAVTLGAGASTILLTNGSGGNLTVAGTSLTRKRRFGRHCQRQCGRWGRVGHHQPTYL